MLCPFPRLLSLLIYVYIYMHPSTFNSHTHTFFSEKSTRFYWNVWTNKKGFRWDMNWDNVGIFLRVASSEFQRDGAMKLKEHCLNDLSFRFGILSSFSLKDRRYICVFLYWLIELLLGFQAVVRQCWWICSTTPQKDNARKEYISTNSCWMSIDVSEHFQRPGVPYY